MLRNFKLNYLLLALASISFFISSCSKEDYELVEDEISFAALSATIDSSVTSGNWVVDYFKNDSTVFTSDYFNYRFSFDSNGVVTASYGEKDYLGTWYIDTVTCTKDSTSTGDDHDDDDDDDDDDHDGKGNGKGKGKGKGNGKGHGKGKGKGHKEKLGKIRFVLSFSVGNDLDALSDSWKIKSYTDSTIQLKSERANEMDYYLGFKRN